MRSRTRGRRGPLQVEDVRRLPGGNVRSTERRLRRADGELHDVHEPRVLRRQSTQAGYVRREQSARRRFDGQEVHAEDLCGFSRRDVRRSRRRLRREDGRVLDLQEPRILRRGRAEQVRNGNRNGRRRRRHGHLQAEDVRGLPERHVRTAERWLRRIDSELRHLHESRVLRRRRKAWPLRRKQRAPSGRGREEPVRTRDVPEPRL